MMRVLKTFDDGVPNLLTEAFLFSPVWVWIFGISIEERRYKMLAFFAWQMQLAKLNRGLDLYCIYEAEYLVGCFYIQDFSIPQGIAHKYAAGILSLSWLLGAKTTYRLISTGSHMENLMRNTKATHCLSHMAVGNSYRRSGYGSSALREVLVSIDKTVVLTTQNINLLRYYDTVGFRNISSSTYQNIPNWILVRDKNTPV